MPTAVQVRVSGHRIIVARVVVSTVKRTRILRLLRRTRACQIGPAERLLMTQSGHAAVEFRAIQVTKRERAEPPAQPDPAFAASFLRAAAIVRSRRRPGLAARVKVLETRRSRRSALVGLTLYVAHR
jgi:hypothetical protein